MSSNVAETQKQIDVLLSTQSSVLTRVLHRRIEFHRPLQNRFQQPIHGTMNISSSTTAPIITSPTHISSIALENTGFRQPSACIFAEDISYLMKWPSIHKIGIGLENIGQTAFVNVILQCLAYTPPLANYLSSRKHSMNCRVVGFCLLCEFENFIPYLITSNIISTEKLTFHFQRVISHLHTLSTNFRIGHTGDAHEFLCFVLSSLQNSCINNFSHIQDSHVLETSVIHRIFGGYLHSHISCPMCRYQTTYFEPFLHLSLPFYTQKRKDIPSALNSFFSVEEIPWYCRSCFTLVDSKKKLSLLCAPSIFIIHLKRWAMPAFTKNNSSKQQRCIRFVSSPITFESTLNLKDYILPELITSSQDTSSSYDYSLYAVVVYVGKAQVGGHYIAFIKASNEIWYSLDDTIVKQVSLTTVLKHKKEVYMLFYSKNISSRTPSSSSPFSTHFLEPVYEQKNSSHTKSDNESQQLSFVDNKLIESSNQFNREYLAKVVSTDTQQYGASVQQWNHLSPEEIYTLKEQKEKALKAFTPLKFKTKFTHDSWDRELDRGKTKKVKKRKDRDVETASGTKSNVFQECHEQLKKRKEDSTVPHIAMDLDYDSG